MIKLGDKVRFVNENMQGVVTSINGNTAGVMIEDDFEIPVLLGELVKITDTLSKPATEEKPVTVKSAYVKVHSGFHIAFDRVTDDLLELKIHNSENDQAQIACYENKSLKQTLVLEIETNASLGRFSLEKFNQWPEFIFVITPLSLEYQSLPTITKRIRFGAKEFHAGYKQCYFLGRQAYSFRLDAELKTADLKRLTQKDFSEPVSQTRSPQAKILNATDKPQNEIDLHIEKLVDDPRSLTASEMLEVQMKAVEHAIETAHMHKMRSVVLIHGAGNHYLKNKVKNYLTTQKNLVERFADADMLQYGGGATEVWFKP